MEFHNGNRVAPLLTQIRTAYITMDCGMCYVMRLLDGSFVVYDANTGENEEIDRIFLFTNVSVYGKIMKRGVYNAKNRCCGICLAGLHRR